MECLSQAPGSVRLCVTPWTAATRLPHPWDSPGKNTGVGCHFLLQCRKVKSESEVAQSCLTLRDPMDCSLPDSSIHGIFWAGVLEWGAIAFSALEGWPLPKCVSSPQTQLLGVEPGSVFTSLFSGSPAHSCSLHIVTAMFLALVHKPCFGSDTPRLLMIHTQVCEEWMVR